MSFENAAQNFRDAKHTVVEEISDNVDSLQRKEKALLYQGLADMADDLAIMKETLRKLTKR